MRKQGLGPGRLSPVGQLESATEPAGVRLLLARSGSGARAPHRRVGGLSRATQPVFGAVGEERKEANTRGAQRDLGTGSCPTAGIAATVELGSVRAASRPTSPRDRLQPNLRQAPPGGGVIVLAPSAAAPLACRPETLGSVARIRASGDCLWLPPAVSHVTRTPTPMSAAPAPCVRAAGRSRDSRASARSGRGRRRLPAEPPTAVNGTR
jgi:hypothetical protein